MRTDGDPVQSARQSTRSTTDIDNLRPLSLTCVLEATQAVVAYDLQTPIPTVVVPPARLNPGLSVLVRCSDFIPWCWLLWDDHRIAGFECVVYLVRKPIVIVNAPDPAHHFLQSVIWLDQLNDCICDDSPFGTGSTRRLYGFIRKHPMCSLNMFLVL